MEGIITLVIIGFVLTFGSQLLKGIGNIFAASGRVGGWIVGIILVVFLLKTLVFSSTPESVTPPNDVTNTVDYDKSNAGSYEF
jgi:membrane protein insertase Oxa1/YidC/SpoIIIJ